MKFYFHPQAREELEQAIQFYKSQQAGLEKRFLEAVDDAITRVCRNPLIYRKIDESARKCRLLHFPYAVIFRLASEQIEIVAIMHIRRQPDYWKNRK
ncbi:plasmid stabilization system [Methyloglobulus morosus KoM1]|uniref:Plasmid stabilization system n=1 Tax=Methyloglobulus morosus KoM1 TaxID=1116472 RepID=V5BSF8_9GAMM|nr:type II toxin-antitoxin system RelE/ParE family toxin [Methyloglobulus morosus]ESS70804.1 plasmid stabilization system [Methyloglobulus morosus KoM1]